MWWSKLVAILKTIGWILFIIAVISLACTAGVVIILVLAIAAALGCIYGLYRLILWLSPPDTPNQ